MYIPTQSSLDGAFNQGFTILVMTRFDHKDAGMTQVTASDNEQIQSSDAALQNPRETLI